MKLAPIVVSLLDTDLYKFNMDQVIFHKHTDLCGEYYFRCRNEGVVFTKEMFDEINEQSRKMAQQIAELNKIYARMIEAMTVNMPKAPIINSEQ